jgi:hypothetical protein
MRESEPLSHLIGQRLEDAIDEIEMYAMMNYHALKFIAPHECLDRKKLNVCVKDGTIKEFIFTG